MSSKSRIGTLGLILNKSSKDSMVIHTFKTISESMKLLIHIKEKEVAWLIESSIQQCWHGLDTVIVKSSSG